MATEGTPSAPLAPAARPSIPGALRASAVDVFYNSWRLVPANLAWGVGFVAIALIGLSAPALGLLLLPLLALPTVGLFRIAALIARGESVSLADGFAAWRAYLVPALLAGVAISVGVVVTTWDFVGGILSDSMVGWVLGTMAAWGLLLVLAFSIAFWPLLVDPARAERPVRERVRLAGLLVVAYSQRMAALLVVVVAILVASTVAFAALVTIAVAYVALVTSRWVLPATDRLEVRLAERAQAGSSASMR